MADQRVNKLLAGTNLVGPARTRAAEQLTQMIQGSGNRHGILSLDHLDAEQGTLVAGDLLIVNSGGRITRLAIGTAAQLLRVGAGGLPEWGSVPVHNLLSGTHSGDTLTASVVAGDIIIGNATPKWARLAAGSAAQLLRIGVDGLPAWGAVPPHNLLSGTHSGDTLGASVVRGDVIIGNSTPKWARLAAGSAGKVLTSDGTDVSWQTPATAAAFDDVLPVAVADMSGTNAPSISAYAGSLKAPEFDEGVAAKSKVYQFRIPHRYKQGSNLRLQLHLFVPDNPGAGDVRFEATYTWCNIDGAEPGATTITKVLSFGASGGDLGNEVMAFDAISGTGMTIGSIFSVLIRRDGGNAADTWSKSVWIKAVNLVIEIDALGSAQEYTK